MIFGIEWQEAQSIGTRGMLFLTCSRRNFLEIVQLLVNSPPTVLAPSGNEPGIVWNGKDP